MRRPQLSWLLSYQILLLFSTIQNTVLANGQCLNDQRTHLMHLKNSLSSDLSYSTKIVVWNPEEDCCNWRGVGCDAPGRVTTLELDNESITCQVDNLTSLSRLQFLENLNLGFNNFINIPIPKEIGNLTNLVYLNLSQSGFVGQFPSELSNLRKLVSLDLSNLNNLKMENPTLKMVLQNLSNIEEIYLDGVDLSAERSDCFQIIATFLPKLRVLSLRANYISKPIHISLSTMIQNLSQIYLDNVNISTEVPEFFANMSNLTTLSLSNCNLLGRFPMKIFQVPTLQTLDISDNRLLEGSLPPFPKNSSLREILLHYTNFSGSLPNSIENLHMLSRLDLSACNFSGTIPAALPNLLELFVIDLSENKFTGQIPLFQSSKNLLYIDLSYNSLTGSLSSGHFKGLQSLETINLMHNFLSGSLPTTLFKLPALRSIQLSKNQFSGEIDEIHDRLSVSQTRLMSLDVRSNQFNGSFPKLLFELKQLEELLISSNSFTDTIQLETFNNLPKLTSLDLSSNNLTVKLQSNISSLARIQMLGLGSCKLKRFPDIRSFEELTYLDLSNNNFTGEIPNWIWNLSLWHVNLSFNSYVGLQKPYEIPHYLGVLDLHSNQLQGEVPIPSASAAYVDYSRNNFSGPIPSLIGLYLNNTLFLSMSDNSLTGSIPDSICIRTLGFLDLSNNELNGTIPSCLITNTATTLGVLNLAGNNLSGSISDTFSEGCSLETLALGMNHLQGNLPRTLSKCSMLEVLNLGHNEFEDVFPCMLKNSSSLRVLILRANKFHGDLECFGYTYSWPRLQIIDIASNNITGVLSFEFFSSLKNMLTLDFTPENGRADLGFDIYGSTDLYYHFEVGVTMKGFEIKLEKILTIFASIDFSNNKFSGTIPESIGDLKALHVLDLSHNEITGEIPSSIGKLSNIESLDLSRNQLTGEIPPALKDLNFLSFLNLSFNSLTGKIPTGPHFDTFSNDSYIGNVGLCGFPLNVRSGNANDSEPPSSMPLVSNNNEIEWMYITAALGYTIGLGIFNLTLVSNNNEIEWMYITAALGYTIGLGIFSMLLLFCGRWRNKLFHQVDQVLVKVLGNRRAMPISGEWREPIRRL